MNDPVVIAAWVTGGLALLAVVVGIVLPKMLRLDEKLNRVHEQVANSHDTNLRDDIDELRDLVLDGFRRVSTQMTDLRVDLAWERRERIDLARRIEGKTPIA